MATKKDNDILLFNGKSAMPLDQFINLVGGSDTDGNRSDIVKLYTAVSWLYRGVTLLESGVAAMPFEIRKGENVIYEFDPNSGKQTAVPRGLEWLVDLPMLSGQVCGAATLRGKAYIGNLKNTVKTTNLRWYIPDTIEPRYDSLGVVTYFERTLKSGMKSQPIPPEDMIHFWPPDMFVENGAAVNYAGRAALAGAGVLHSQDEFLRGYFERGLVKATLLKYLKPLQAEESKRVKEWWKRVFTGVNNAFATEVVRGDFDTITIGEGIKDLQNTALTAEQRESIATALGIPQSKMTQPPGGLGDSKTPDDLTFITDTIIPACTWIARSWNKYFFMDLGYMLVFTPQKLPIMQQDEERRSAAFRNYVGGSGDYGYTVEATEAILGIHVPSEITDKYREPAPAVGSADLKPEEESEGEQIQGTESQSQKAALYDWRDERDQFLRWVENRKGRDISVDDFTARHLSLADKRDIYMQWQNDEEINGLMDDYADIMESLNV